VFNLKFYFNNKLKVIKIDYILFICVYFVIKTILILYIELKLNSIVIKIDRIKNVREFKCFYNNYRNNIVILFPFIFPTVFFPPLFLPSPSSPSIFFFLNIVFSAFLILFSPVNSSFFASSALFTTVFFIIPSSGRDIRIFITFINREVESDSS